MRRKPKRPAGDFNSRLSAATASDPRHDSQRSSVCGKTFSHASTHNSRSSFSREGTLESRRNASPRRSTTGRGRTAGPAATRVRPTPHLITKTFDNRLRASCGQPAHGGFPHAAKTLLGTASMPVRAADYCF